VIATHGIGVEVLSLPILIDQDDRWITAIRIQDQVRRIDTSAKVDSGSLLSCRNFDRWPTVWTNQAKNNRFGIDLSRLFRQ